MTKSPRLNTSSKNAKNKYPRISCEPTRLLNARIKSTTTSRMLYTLFASATGTLNRRNCAPTPWRPMSIHSATTSRGGNRKRYAWTTLDRFCSGRSRIPLNSTTWGTTYSEGLRTASITPLYSRPLRRLCTPNRKQYTSVLILQNRWRSGLMQCKSASTTSTGKGSTLSCTRNSHQGKPCRMLSLLA